MRQLHKQLQQQWNVTKSFEVQTWQAGYAQGEFGEADFIVNGKVKRLNFFVLSFPIVMQRTCRLCLVPTIIASAKY